MKCDRKWFSGSNMAAGSNFVQKKLKVAYWSEMARHAIKSDIQSLAGREMPQIHGNWALGDKFLQFCMMLHMGIRYSKTTANKVG